MLECNDKSLYTGITTDVQRRFKEHSSSDKGAKYTKVKRPLKLVYVEESSNRSIASKREYAIKKLPRKKKLELIKNKENNMSKKEEFLELMSFRHACKIFDENRKISEEDINYILEVARESPSSFGMEAWKFLVITNSELQEKLKPFCWGQAQITTCSHLVVVLAGIENLKVESGVVRSQLARRDMPNEKLDGYVDLYASHLSDTLSSDENIYHWSAKQTYIASANMMSAAAFIGIDSCAIEGFEKEAVEKVLELDTTKYQVAMLLPFGYRVKEQPSQVRSAFDDVVEFIK
ncbi:MAG: NAD(P)H-dependent oxidoreductase [Helicobacteraceae bacterium]|nr:NAD(P)H-dependent oxidoreductase [Helicobacteraceae bacterium]